MLKYLSRIQQTVTFISAELVTCVSLAANVRGKAIPLWARCGHSEKFRERLPCGLSCRMLMQKTSRVLTNQIAKILAALQRDFPKADIEWGELGLFRNRTFVARVSSV